MKRWLWGLLVLAVLSATPGEAQNYGAWVTGNVAGNGGVYAATSNESGGFLGRWCWPGYGCQWRISMQTSCVLNEEYGVLVNAPHGAMLVKLRCLGPLKDTTAHRYAFIDDADATEAVAGGDGRGTIGFAVPQESGQFRVIRFQLSGMQSALAELKRLQGRMPAVPAAQGTKDTLL